MVAAIATTIRRVALSSDANAVNGSQIPRGKKIANFLKNATNDEKSSRKRERSEHRGKNTVDEEKCTSILLHSAAHGHITVCSGNQF